MTFVPTEEEVLDAVQADENTGWCRVCGEEQMYVEPDSNTTPCESCGAPAVRAAQEWLLRMVA